MNFTTKNIGDITELKCILAFRQRGIIVSIPYGEDSPYDLVAEIDGSLKRVQCKTSRPTRSGGAYEFNTSVSHTNTTSTVSKSYGGKIDYFMTIVEEEPYLISVEECGVSKKALRKEPPKNGQVVGVSLLENYHLDRYV